jgi:inner membrane protein
MPSTISHAAVAIAAGTVFSSRTTPRHFWLVSITCSIIADIDLILFLCGVPYDHFFGHRGFFHSIFFGLLVGIVATKYVSSLERELPGAWIRYCALFCLVSVSHGLLDALSNGSIGIAFFSPFDSTRYFFPWQPISMVRMKVFLTTWNFSAIRSELFWVWIPSGLVVLIAILVRTMVRKTAAQALNK